MLLGDWVCLVQFSVSNLNGDKINQLQQTIWLRSDVWRISVVSLGWLWRTIDPASSKLGAHDASCGRTMHIRSRLWLASELSLSHSTEQQGYLPHLWARSDVGFCWGPQDYSPRLFLKTIVVCIFVGLWTALTLVCVICGWALGSASMLLYTLPGSLLYHGHGLERVFHHHRVSQR